MTRNRGFSDNLVFLFLSDGALREFLVLGIFTAAAFLVSLPGKSYSFFLVQELVPGCFTITLMAGSGALLFLSIRGVYREEYTHCSDWKGAVFPGMLQIFFSTILVLPFFILSASLSGIGLGSLFGGVLMLTGMILFFRLLALVFSRLFERGPAPGFILIGLAVLSLLVFTPSIPGIFHPVTLLLSLRTVPLKDLYLLSSLSWIPAVMMFFISALVWRWKRTV